MKKLIIIAVILLVLAGALVSSRNIIAKYAVSAGIKSVTGLRLDMKSICVGITETKVGVDGLKIFNPSGFKEGIMVDMPELYIDYDLRAFLKKKVHMEELEINLREFIVSRNEEGRLNIDSLKAVQSRVSEEVLSEKKEKTSVPEFRIDVLHLKIGRVIFKDYSKGGPSPATMEFDVNIDESYKNITDPEALARLIVVKALIKTTIARLTDFNLAALQEGVSGILKGVVQKSQEAAQKALDIGREIGQKTEDTVEETLEKTADALKNVLPLGK